MRRYKQPRTIVDTLGIRDGEQQRDIQNIYSAIANPTVPVYDTVPDDLIDGNIWVQESGGLAYRSNGVNRTVGSPQVYTQSTFNTVTGADGLEAYLEFDAGAQNYWWRLRYSINITDQYKWQAVGCAPMHISDNTSVSITGTAYSLWGPTLVIPRGGAYLVRFGGFARAAQADSDVVSYMSPAYPGSSPQDANAAEHQQLNAWDPSFSSRPAWSVSNATMIIASQAGDVTLGYRNTITGKTVEWKRRWLTIEPVRLTNLF